MMEQNGHLKQQNDHSKLKDSLDRTIEGMDK